MQTAWYWVWKNYMRLGWKSGLLLLGSLALGSAPAMAAPDLSGSWNITFYTEPNHTAGATQCLVFTKTGNVAGEPNSGTWTSPSFSGWKGQWIQEGDFVRFFGFTNGSLATSEHGGLMVSSSLMRGEFDHFSASGSVSSSGAWSATKVNNCSRVNTAVRRSGDPSK